MLFFDQQLMASIATVEPKRVPAIEKLEETFRSVTVAAREMAAPSKNAPGSVGISTEGISFPMGAESALKSYTARFGTGSAAGLIGGGPRRTFSRGRCRWAWRRRRRRSTNTFNVVDTESEIARRVSTDQPADSTRVAGAVMPYQPAVLGTARLNNFRLNYLTPAQAAERPAKIRIILGGVDVAGPGSATRVIYKSITIRDLVFDTPNTCNLTFYGAAPGLGQRLEVWVDSNDPTLLFGGELQTVDRTYKGQPGTVLHPCTAIDDTAAANRRRPLGLWTNTSATTIAQWLISTYAPGFSSAGVELGLPRDYDQFRRLRRRHERLPDGRREDHRRLLVL